MLGIHIRGFGERVKQRVGMEEENRFEKIARLSGKTTSKGLDALARHGFDLRKKLSAPINRVPRRAPPPEKPKSEP
jgi:hypothetical protein